MFLLTLSVSALEITMLSIGAISLVCAIYFFYHSRKALRLTMEAAGNGYPAISRPKNEAPAQQTQPQSVTPMARPAVVAWPEPLSAKPPIPDAESLSVQSVAHLKANLQQQQTVLNQLLRKIEDLESDAADSRGVQQQNDELQEQIEALELALHEKEVELKQARQQETIAQQMAARIDEVYNEFDVLQQKIATLEAQATGHNGLVLELEDLQQAHEQLRRELTLKQNKIDDLMLENGRLLHELNATEDKLSRANQQYQQSVKRTQVMQESHSNLYNLSESNTKLQKDLRRIGELESMLSMMTQDRMRANKQ